MPDPPASVSGMSLRAPVMALLLMLGGGACAGEARWRVGAGVADEIDGRASPVLALAVRPGPRWEAMLGYIGRRPGVPDALFVAGSRRLQRGPWFASAGLAWVSEDNAVLSGHVQAMTGVGLELRHGAVSLRHLSNGGTGGRNRGETFVLFEYGW
jgi:hypothetical protein